MLIRTVCVCVCGALPLGLVTGRNRGRVSHCLQDSYDGKRPVFLTMVCLELLQVVFL